MNRFDRPVRLAKFLNTVETLLSMAKRLLCGFCIILLFRLCQGDCSLDGTSYDPTTLTDLRVATVFTYVETIFITDCQTDPATFIESRTAYHDQLTYPLSTTTTFSQQNATVSITYTFSDLLVTSFTPNGTILMSYQVTLASNGSSIFPTPDLITLHIPSYAVAITTSPSITPTSGPSIPVSVTTVTRFSSSPGSSGFPAGDIGSTVTAVVALGLLILVIILLYKLRKQSLTEPHLV